MKDIAATSQRTSTSSQQVSESLQQTLGISQDLQETCRGGMNRREAVSGIGHRA